MNGAKQHSRGSPVKTAAGRALAAGLADPPGCASVRFARRFYTPGRDLQGLTLGRRAAQAQPMSLLLPQTRAGVVQSVRLLDIHGDRYLDLALALEDYGSAPITGRIGASECPADLEVGDRVSVSFTMGVITRVTRL